jgi:hypothetical protein
LKSFGSGYNSVEEPHHFYAVHAMVPGKKGDAALAPYDISKILIEEQIQLLS